MLVVLEGEDMKVCFLFVAILGYWFRASLC